MSLRPAKNEMRLKLSAADVIAAAAVLILAALLALWLFLPQRGETRRCVIYLNGEVVEDFNLDGSENRRIPLGGKYPCTVEVIDGEVGFTERTCPNGDCVRSGMLSRPGETAACLPDGAVIVIKGESADVDATAR